MYYDERQINLETDEQEMLWRYIYRHSGLSKARFRSLILPTSELVTFKEGEHIPCTEHFYIILDGLVKTDVIHDEVPNVKHKIKMTSGEMFPLVHMYLNYMPRESFFNRSAMKTTAASKTVRAFAIPVDGLKDISVNPDARDAWTAILIVSLAEIAERPYVDAAAGNVSNKDNSNSKDNDNLLANIINPLFNPLHPSEEPVPLLKHGSRITA